MELLRDAIKNDLRLLINFFVFHAAALVASSNTQFLKTHWTALLPGIFRPLFSGFQLLLQQFFLCKLYQFQGRLKHRNFLPGGQLQKKGTRFSYFKISLSSF